MGNAQTLAVHGGEGNLAGVVVAAIIEADAQGDVVLPVVEQRDAVHAAAHYANRFFHFFSFL